MRCERHRAAPGFTLVELLVAIMILAVVAAIGWRGLDTILRGRVALTDNMEQFHSMQLTFAQLQSDCAQVVSAVDFPGHPPIVATGAGVTLLRSIDVDNGPQQFEVVRYRFDRGELTRAVSKPSRDLTALEHDWTEGDAAAPMRLQSGLDEVTMRVLRDPPAALEVTLRLKDHGADISKLLLVGAQ
jgi:general secretion pathway protein J